MNKEELNKTLDEIFEQNKKELQEEFNMATSWGIEACSIDKKTGKLRILTLEEALELKDNPDYEVVSIKDYSPEEVMKQFSEHLAPEELESLKRPILNLQVPFDATWDVEKWLEYSKTNKIMFYSSDK